ncbi:hypothetical protein VPH35_022872 [Triticum aestivum]
MEGEAEMEAEARGKSVREGIEHATGTQDRVPEMEGKVKRKSAESRKGIEHAARRKHVKSLSEIKSATKKVASRENLTRIKLETKNKLDEIEEAVKGTMESDELPERISTSEDTKLEIDKAKEMGEEGEVRDEVEKLDIEEAEGMEEKMQTGPFFDMYCGGLKACWSWFFSSPCKDTSE